MRILGIDFGEARIGIAVSDPLGITAQALETIHWSGEWKKPLARIKELVDSYKCTKLVVGLPEHLVNAAEELSSLSRSSRILFLMLK